MDAPDVESPPLPDEAATPSALNTGYIVACGLMLPPLLYVGSFAYLVLASVFGLGVPVFDSETWEVLNVVYAPLIWIVNAILFLAQRAGFAD
jgi:hypothetical protein